MYTQGYITEAEYNEAKAQELVFTTGEDSEDDSQYYPGLWIRSSPM